ncbi:hypothetical protein [Micromonospora sp. NPDC047527]
MESPAFHVAYWPDSVGTAGVDAEGLADEGADAAGGPAVQPASTVIL